MGASVKFEHPSEDFIKSVEYTPEELKRILAHLRKIGHVEEDQRFEAHCLALPQFTEHDPSKK